MIANIQSAFGFRPAPSSSSRPHPDTNSLVTPPRSKSDRTSPPTRGANSLPLKQPPGHDVGGSVTVRAPGSTSLSPPPFTFLRDNTLINDNVLQTSCETKVDPTYHPKTSQVPFTPSKNPVKRSSKIPSESAMIAKIQSAFGSPFAPPPSSRPHPDTNLPLTPPRSKSNRTSPPNRGAKSLPLKQPPGHDVGGCVTVRVPGSTSLSPPPLRRGDSHRSGGKLKNNDPNPEAPHFRRNSSLSGTYYVKRQNEPLLYESVH